MTRQFVAAVVVVCKETKTVTVDQCVYSPLVLPAAWLHYKICLYLVSGSW